MRSFTLLRRFVDTAKRRLRPICIALTTTETTIRKIYATLARCLFDRVRNHSFQMNETFLIVLVIVRSTYCRSDFTKELMDDSKQ